VAAGDVGDARQRMAPWLTEAAAAAAARGWPVVALDERSTVTLRRPSNGEQRCSRNDTGDATAATKATNPAKSRFFCYVYSLYLLYLFLSTMKENMTLNEKNVDMKIQWSE